MPLKPSLSITSSTAGNERIPPRQFHLLSFEGYDPYACAGGLASRITGLTEILAEVGYETHLWFVGDPDLARGGIEPYGVEVLKAAALAGLQVVDRVLPQRGVRGRMHALDGLQGVDIVNLCSPLDPESRLVLFHGAAAILANSQHEPFGLVGLETMAAGGLACIGYTGEDYAVPGYNALALETNDPQEFLDLFGALRVHPAVERSLRRAGRVTAQHDTWSKIMQRILLPRLRLMAGRSNETERVPYRHGKML